MGWHMNKRNALRKSVTARIYKVGRREFRDGVPPWFAFV